MDPDISLSRRALLGGAGVTLGGGLIGTGLFAPTWLPDPVTDTLLGIYPNPPARVWHPEISDTHADRAVTFLDETVVRANALQKRVDMNSLPDNIEFYLDTSDPSGGWLESARSNSSPEKRLSYATGGLQFAGEVIGAANVALERADPKVLVKRGNRLRTAADTVRDSFSEYRVANPARDLAYLFVTERELASVRVNSHRSGIYTGGIASAEEYSDHAIVRTWGSQLRAKQSLRTARYYRDHYRATQGGGARPYESSLNDALTALTAAVSEFPTREEMRTTVEEEFDSSHETPYGAARWTLLMLCYDNYFRFGFDTGGTRPGHTVQHVVAVAQALLARRAHEFALSELDVSPDDTDYDSGRAFRAKRRAVRTFRSVRSESDSSFAGVLAQDAVNLIRSGEVGVGSWGHGNGDTPAWHDRVEAATYYLVATGLLRDLGDVLGMIFDGAR